MGTIRFELRKDKCTKDGKSPVRLVFQLKQDRRYYNVGKSLSVYNWDEEKQRAQFLNKPAVLQLESDLRRELNDESFKIPRHSLLLENETIDINKHLDDIKDSVTEYEKNCLKKKIEYSIDDVIKEVKTEFTPMIKKSEPKNLLFEFIDQYIDEHKGIREEGSLQVYKSLKRHLHDFQRHTGQKIIFAKIDYPFFQAFQTFLVTGAGLTKNKNGDFVQRVPLNNITAAKQLSTIKTFLSYARKSGIEINEKYKDFKIKREQMEVIALTNDEFHRLFFLDLSQNKKLAQVRDVFCFGCATGLRYSDLAQLKREHIKKTEIKITVTKTKQQLSIPLTAYSKSILTKYEQQLKPLPVISNQKMNDYLKELCKLAGINEAIEIVRFQGSKRIVNVYPKYELIGSHTGRKTFATLSLEKKMSAEQVMAIGGWKDYKSFERYVNITDTLKNTVMSKAWDTDISELKLKAV